VICLAPRVREESVRPRLQSGSCARPLNFTVRPRLGNSSVLSRRCPECGAAAVQSLHNSFNFRGATHHCSSCNTELRASLTARALWCIPIGVVSVLAAVLITRWLNRTEMAGVVRAAVTGAVGALAVALPMGALAKGFVLRKWTP
jgi:hypothetical protein